MKIFQWPSKLPDIETLKSRGDVNGLIKVLDRREVEIRVEAIKAMEELGDQRFVEPLLQILKDEDTQILLSAVRALSKLNAQGAIEPITGFLKSYNKALRLAAVEALGQLSAHQAVAHLAETLQDDDDQLRMAAVRSYCLIKDEAAVMPLVTALEDKNREVRWAVADALDQLGWHPIEARAGAAYWVAKRRWNKSAEYGPEAVEPLIMALGDDPFSVAEVLAQLGEPAVMPLVQSLDHRDKNVRWAVVGALEKLGDKRAVEPLIASLQATDDAERWMALKLGMASPHVMETTGLEKKLRWAKVRALGRLGDARAVDVLVGVLKSEQDIELRQLTITALGELKDPRAVEALIDELTAAEKDTRKLAVEALGLIGDQQAIAPLATLLKDPEFDVRRAVIDNLGKLGGPAIITLISALKDETIRIQTVNVLKYFGKQSLSPVLDTYYHSKDLGIRQACLWILGCVVDKVAVDALTVALRDEDLGIVAAESLSNIGVPAAAKNLVAYLKESREDQMIGALRRLCTAYDTQNQPEVIKLEPQAKVIGQELCYRGGEIEMQRVFSQLSQEKGIEKIGKLWAGIGGWPMKELA